MKRIALFLLFFAACAHQAPLSLDQYATSYVKLSLALGEHDSDWVDAYYGPPEWREAAKAEKKSIAAIHSEATALREAVGRMTVPPERILGLRHNYLLEQLLSLITRAEMLQGKKFGFEEETRRLYGAVPPRRSEAFFEEQLRALDREIPGVGTLGERVDAYRKRFEIPADKLDAVMRAAMQACRERTLQHIDLPAGESFTLEYVKNQPWSGYNWYKGNYTSLIQINTDLPVALSKVLDLACHEGYPGHHTYNALLEKNLVRDRGWIEYTIYPLFSPQSLIAEGTGNYGLEIAFPDEERIRFDRDVLFPLAFHFDRSEVDKYHRVLKLGSAVSYATNEAARRWIDGEATREQAKAFMMRYGLMNAARAEQQMKFIERYRSYVINYNFGLDLVRAHVEKSPDRWAAFKELISTPMLPSDITTTSTTSR